MGCVLAQVGYLEVVDAMVGQLVKLLWQAESEGKGTFTVCITGDHSTPVEYGDHSHEPVPVAIAPVRYVRLFNAACMRCRACCHVDSRWCAARHVVDLLGGPARLEDIPLGCLSHPDPHAVLAANRNPLGPLSAEPNSHGSAFGDTVRRYDEISAATGALGRFPGSQVMTLVKGVLSTVNHASLLK